MAPWLAEKRRHYRRKPAGEKHRVLLHLRAHKAYVVLQKGEEVEPRGQHVIEIDGRDRKRRGERRERHRPARRARCGLEEIARVSERDRNRKVFQCPLP